MHLVHRDVKPANIRIGKHGEVKLLDFGIARAANMTREAHTANNAMMGSSQYMAPERFHEDDVFPPSDVYALGCIVYEGLTGERFFGDKSMKQIYGTMLSPRKYEEHLGQRMLALGSQPDEVQALVRRLLSGDAEQRPAASEVARAFVSSWSSIWRAMSVATSAARVRTSTELSCWATCLSRPRTRLSGKRVRACTASIRTSTRSSAARSSRSSR